MKRSNTLKVMAIAASSLFLTGCPLDFDSKQPAVETTASHKWVDIDEKSFPDPIFREYVSANIDQDKDRNLSIEELSAVTVLDVGYQGIADLKGIEYFTYLRELDCVGNHLQKLDISAFSRLESLTCNYNPLTELVIPYNSGLQILRTADTLLMSLDVSRLQQLTELVVDNEVNVSGAERGSLKVVRSTRRPTHPEWETNPE